MQAIVYDEYGGPEVLRLAEVADPKVGPDSVLVRAKAASVNPVDWKLREGGLDAFMDTVFPAIPGWDVAGVVEQPGIAVPEFAPGDEVIGYVRKDVVGGGTYAELVAAPVRTLARKPANVTWTQAASLPLAGLTAYQALLKTLRVGKGDTLVVHAASGGVGLFAVQIAQTLGARVIGTASPANHEFLRGLGAEPVSYGEGLPQRVRELVPEGATAVLDLYGAGTLATTSELAAPEARVASVADPSVAQQGGSYVFVRPDSADLSALVDMVERGELTIEVAETFPLSQAAAAQRRSAEGHPRGKIAIEVS
ncbi:NADP-dependent oxidoreductase [Salinactinospora qingdaonensis]|uniref:NADP-dependent oxidoreductase n=1 Tax=Salinactinospora qingdaonensis TaxID=702744 RepID=A0ABP7EXE5_9ACTN